MTTGARNPTRLSALHHSHVGLNATMVERDGWQQPEAYDSVQRELAALRESVGLCDVSAQGKLLLQGQGLDGFLEDVLEAEGAPEVGRVQASELPVDAGPERVVVLRLAEDEATMLTGVNRATAVLGSLTEDRQDCLHVSDVTSAYSAVRVAGPSGPTLLASLTDVDLSAAAFPDLTCAEVKLAEVYGLLMRVDRAGTSSYDVLFGLEYGVYVWEALLDAAQEYGGSPVGFLAMERLISGT